MEPRQYIVTLIDGDYCHLTDIKTGEPIVVAMALLPWEIDEGQIVLYDKLTYTILG
ncbi:MAG: hypothetical protein IJ555_05735 [Ruminococcus sp.]|nr:hypothetical protein [Ruminococcus sp.]MBR1750480.1 hypothetical protein [Ruminococcus sp.]